MVKHPVLDSLNAPDPVHQFVAFCALRLCHLIAPSVCVVPLSIASPMPMREENAFYRYSGNIGQIRSVGKSSLSEF